MEGSRDSIVHSLWLSRCAALVVAYTSNIIKNIGKKRPLANDDLMPGGWGEEVLVVVSSIVIKSY